VQVGEVRYQPPIQTGPEASNKTFFDEDGDLLLLVGLEEQVILVSSKILTSTSGVFEALLLREFGRRKEFAEVNLPVISSYENSMNRVS
jgi:hypothetical protein